MHQRIIDVVHQLWVAQSDMPGLTRGYRDIDLLPGLVEGLAELGAGEGARQQRLVADHQRVDERVLLRLGHGAIQLLLVGRCIAAERPPGPGAGWPLLWR